jgi:serine/threonine-protein phosphatase CPPED1
MKRLAAWTTLGTVLVLNFAFACALVSVMAAQAPAPGRPAAAAPFFFIQLTDPQLGMFADNENVEQETANLEFAVATINRLRPAFVVVTGDLVNRTGDESQIAAYLGIMRKIDPAIRVCNAPGNHDVGNTATPDSLAAYERRFGADHYAFRHGDFAGIVLNSVLMAAPEKAPVLRPGSRRSEPESVGGDAARQDQWLRAELQRARADGSRHIVVFQHHPLFVKDPGEPDQYENIPGERRKKYLSLFAEFGVKQVFAGHLHHNAVVRAGELEMVGTGPIGKPLGEGARSGMRIVTVTERGVEHRYYDLGELPHRLDVR